MTVMTFADPGLAEPDGFRVETDPAHERADVILDRPPFNIMSMPYRDQLRPVFEALDQDARVRVIVLRAVGEHFSSGGNIKGFVERPERERKRRKSAEALLEIVKHCLINLSGMFERI
jgi:2-oxoglutaroyl-CoA hydrolase